jgi:hypothetical protein
MASFGYSPRDISSRMGVVLAMTDWAARAARRVLDEYQHRPTQARVDHCAAIIATFAEPLVALLRESRREHYHHNENDVHMPMLCCPRCTCNSWNAVAEAQDSGELDAEHEPNSDEPCTCGADEWNRRVDEVLK